MVPTKHLAPSELSELLQNIESRKNKMLDVDPTLEKTIIH